jgi:predicted CXXCH cytochrome family protein
LETPSRALPWVTLVVLISFGLTVLCMLPTFDVRSFPHHAFASNLNLTEEDCRCCHAQGVPDRHHLLVETASLECIDCHQILWDEASLEYDVVVTRDCLVCHSDSLSDRHHVLTEQGDYECLSCHAVELDPETGKYFIDFINGCQPSDPPSGQSGNSPFGSLTGLVTDLDGTELEEVTIATGDGRYSTLTVTEGTYQLDFVSPGEYTLVATKWGYTRASHQVAVAGGQTVGVNFVLTAFAPTWGAASVVGAESRSISRIDSSLFGLLILVGTLLLWKGRGRR